VAKQKSLLWREQFQDGQITQFGLKMVEISGNKQKSSKSTKMKPNYANDQL